ncbi:pilus assembly protein PilM [Fontivita pretiosa]|uniref:pilus assembly protein PilM n=1 Tax=Fontivita pretiosa TaxID=2989684 RepID=UPI003D17F6EA
MRMLANSLLGNLFKLGGNSAPIGVDLGSAAIKLAQVNPSRPDAPGQCATACVSIPDELRADPRARIDFFVQSVPRLLEQGGFRGRQVVLALPACCTHFERVRIPLLDEQATRQAIVFEAADKLPFHPTRGLIRHIIAGEIYENNEPRNEVIVMAARRQFTDALLAAAAKAKLDTIGVMAEPLALGSGLGAGATPEESRAIVDIGSSGTRVYILAGERIQFARAVTIGAEHFDLAIAQQLRLKLSDARAMRQQAAVTEVPPAASDARQQTLRIEQACQTPLRKLIEELDLCLRYHTATFPTTPVKRLVFVGGGSASRRLCQRIAVELNLPAELADPFARNSSDSGWDAVASDASAMPSCAWWVAVGLSRSRLAARNAA